MRQNQCNNCVHIAITFKQNELERPGCAQIIAYERSFSDLKYFLKIDSLEAKPFCLKWKKGFNFLELCQNHSKDYLHWALTSKRNKLESSGWAQIIAYKRYFSDLMYFLKIESQEAKLFCLKGFKGHYQPALLHHWVQGSSAGRKSLSINIHGCILASVKQEGLVTVKGMKRAFAYSNTHVH